MIEKFLPAHEVLLGEVVINLPSPVIAQRYRVEILYEGPMNDKAVIGIRNCDPAGPLVLHVTTMVPALRKGQFHVVGRAFSRTAKTRAIRVQGPDYVPEERHDLFIKKIQRTVLMTGEHGQAIESCSTGNIMGLVGIDQFLLKNGTITDSWTVHNVRVGN